MNLFRINETWTTQALELNQQTIDALTPLMNQYITEGYSIRDIAHVMDRSVVEMECDAALALQEKLDR